MWPGHACAVKQEGQGWAALCHAFVLRVPRPVC